MAMSERSLFCVYRYLTAWSGFATQPYARLAELVYAGDLKFPGFGHVGSTPTPGTNSLSAKG